MTATLIRFPARGAPLNLCDRPAVTAVCVTLGCGGGLAYQAGRWQHTIGAGSSCTDPQPANCQHRACHQTAEIGQPCAASSTHCCGCCWISDDDLEGRQLWPTN